MCSLFESFLRSLPKTRSEWVNDLDIPEDIQPSADIWTNMSTPVDVESISTETVVSEVIQDLDDRSLSSDSSLALSRAMTDSDIDYERYVRYYKNPLPNRWDELRLANDAFPPEYLASLTRFRSLGSPVMEAEEVITLTNPYRNDILLARLERLYADCRPFSPGDPALVELETALADLKITDTFFSDDIVI